MIRRATLAVVFALLVSAEARAAAKAVDLTVDDHARHYSYVAPAHAKGPLPVVLVLPDFSRQPDDVLTQDKWAVLSSDKGFIAAVLTPLPVDPTKPEIFQTNPGYWSDGSGRGNAKRGDLDDVAYARAVIDDLAKRESIDKKRIFAVGFGNGGSMVQQLGVGLSDRVAAIASVSGHLWKMQTPPLRPLPVMLIHGAADPVEPIGGGPGLNMWTHWFEQRPTAIKSARIWARALTCEDEPTDKPLAKGVIDSSWSECNGQGSVDYLVVPGQGHHWPGGADDHLVSLGGRADALDATPYIWDWFAAHPKP